jgi:putative oxidoreductase
MNKLFRTTDDYALTVLRLGLGIVFFAHGAQKMLGWFGGMGFSATMHMFEQYMGIPAVFALLAILAEFLGGIGLLLGALGRVAAFGIIMNMLVAIFKVHAHFGFFANWGGNQKGEGIEFHLLAIAAALAILIGGSGALSTDRVIAQNFGGAALRARPA